MSGVHDGPYGVGGGVLIGTQQLPCQGFTMVLMGWEVKEGGDLIGTQQLFM